MSPDKNNEPIKITLDDLARVETAAPAGALAPSGRGPGGAKVYGSVGEAADQRVETHEERGSILLQAWFYLGIAGLLGAILAWAISEPAFIDSGGHRWGNLWMMPMVVTLQCVGFAIAESIVERSAKKAVVRGLLALPLGVVLSFVFDFAAEIMFRIGVSIAAEAGAQTFRNPAFWVARGLAWMVFGAAGGVVYGIVGQSSKKTLYGALGGVIGAGLGGMLFDPMLVVCHRRSVGRQAVHSIQGSHPDRQRPEMRHLFVQGPQRFGGARHRGNCRNESATSRPRPSLRFGTAGKGPGFAEREFRADREILVSLFGKAA